MSVSYNLQNGLPTGWTHQSGAIGTAHSLAYGISLGDAGTIGCDTSHPTARVTSPRFASCTEVRVKMEGGVSGGALVSNVASLPCSTSTSGFLGAAVRSTTTGDYLMNGNCMTSSGWESSGYASCWSTFDTSSLTGDGFVVDLIDYKGGGGWGCNSFVTVELNGCVGLAPPPPAAPVSVSYTLQAGVVPAGWTRQSGALNSHSSAAGMVLGEVCDHSHPTARVTSPRFASCTEVRVKMEGGVSGGALVSNVASLPCSTSTSGFLGAAVRSTTTGDYLMNGNCMTSSGWESSGYASCWSTFDTSSLTGDGFVVDLIDYKGGGGWGCNSFVTVELNGCVGLVV